MSETNKSEIKWMVGIVILIVATCISATFAVVNRHSRETIHQVRQNREKLATMNGDMRVIKTELKYVNKHLEDIKAIIEKKLE
jgi:septal ring factor EnvC (AmiA/AmiB activator)